MFIFTPNSNLEKIAQSLWKGALWLQTLEKMNGAWVRNILAESAAQHANPDIGALTNAGQMVLAMVPIIALAIFGASRSTSEYEVTGAQGDFAAFASLGAMQVSRRSRTPWALCSCEFTTTTPQGIAGKQPQPAPSKHSVCSSHGSTDPARVLGAINGPAAKDNNYGVLFLRALQTRYA